MNRDWWHCENGKKSLGMHQYVHFELETRTWIEAFCHLIRLIWPRFGQILTYETGAPDSITWFTFVSIAFVKNKQIKGMFWRSIFVNMKSIIFTMHFYSIEQDHVRKDCALYLWFCSRTLENMLVLWLFFQFLVSEFLQVCNIPQIFSMTTL